MIDAFCLILADNYSNAGMKILADYRSAASIPFGGRYRLIDFALSAICTANIRDVGVVAREKYTSLTDHLKSGRDFDLNRKNGGLKMITPQILQGENLNESEFAALKSADDYINHMLQNYCIIIYGNLIFNADLRDMLEAHIKSGAELSVGVKDDKKLLPIYILHKNKLLKIIEQGENLNIKSVRNDVLLNNAMDFSINFVEINGYVRAIDAIEDYVAASFDLLDNALYKSILSKRILTKIHDSAPTIYRENPSVQNSLFADGCAVYGDVSNSIIFRDVIIGEGAIVRDSILMQGCVVEPGAVVERCVADKKVRFKAGTKAIGSEKSFKIFKKSREIA